MIIDKRATQAIKISLNKRFKNKNSENLQLAKIISQFSHKTILEAGSRFESRDCFFYVVGKCYSPFWVCVTYAPPRASLFFTPEFPFQLWYQPDWTRASRFHKKKVFKPFSKRPFIKNRNRKFYFQKINPKKNYYIPQT